MSVTPWNRIDPAISPFVNLFSQAGVAARDFDELGGIVISHVIHEQWCILNKSYVVWFIS